MDLVTGPDLTGASRCIAALAGLAALEVGLQRLFKRWPVQTVSVISG